MFSRRSIAGLLALACVAAAAPIAAYAVPSLIGADESRVVLTGSMEPALEPGDVVFLETDIAVDEVREGDVITFHPHAAADETYTHRVVEVASNTGGTVLVTKGDANEGPDPMRTDDSMLVGRVDRSLPAYGKAIVVGQDLPLELSLVVLSLVTVAVELRAMLASQTRFEPQAYREPEDEPSNSFPAIRRRGPGEVP